MNLNKKPMPQITPEQFAERVAEKLRKLPIVYLVAALEECNREYRFRDNEKPRKKPAKRSRKK